MENIVHTRVNGSCGAVPTVGGSGDEFILDVITSVPDQTLSNHQYSREFVPEKKR
jgi:hypothetical protein